MAVTAVFPHLRKLFLEQHCEINLFEAHVGSVASWSDRIHHRINVFTGVGRIWAETKTLVSLYVKPRAIENA